MPTTSTARLVLPIKRKGHDLEACYDPDDQSELARKGNREAFVLFVERLAAPVPDLPRTANLAA